MDLGAARLRKFGINNLHCAVHPQHGVVWTDGKGIYLAPIHLEGHQLQNAASVKLGEFENVTSVHWSSITTGDSCHMCVVHQQNVTVWRVSGALPKLNFKQVRKINVRPVPQGCLWNPCNDVLCLLSRHQCSFYFRHDLNKGSYAFPALESGSIVCGCWSPDGAKLIICVGTVLLIYRWADISATLDDFSAAAWRIPGLEGRLTSIAPILKDSIVVAAEIPLESLCKQQDLFRVPDAHGDGQKNSGGLIRPFKSSSAIDNLMNLQCNSEAISDSRSTLTVIHLSDRSRDPIKLSTVPLKGVLTPDILLYEKSSQCVVVGSNSQSQLHIYALLEKHLAYCGNIQLDKGQRPKGLCSMPTHTGDRGAALVILVGQREVEESGFLTPSLESEFKLSLRYIILKAGSHHHSSHGHHGDSTRETSSVHTKSSSLIKPEPVKAHHVKNLSDPSVQKWADSGRREQQTSHMTPTDDPTKLSLSPSEDSSLDLEQLVTKPLADDDSHKKKLIEDLSSEPSHEGDLEVDRVSFSSQPPSFDNSKLAASYQLEHTEQIKVDQTDSEQIKVDQTDSEQIKVDQTDSEQIKVDQTDSEQIKVDQTDSEQIKVDQTDSEQIKVDQTDSEQIKVDQTDSLQNSIPDLLQEREVVEDAHVKSQMLKSTTSMQEELQTEIGEHLMLNSMSEKAEDSTDFCQLERQKSGYKYTDINSDYMQKLHQLQNNNEVDLLSNRTSISSQTEKVTILTHLNSETKTMSICSTTDNDSPEDLSNSDRALQLSAISSQTDSVQTSETLPSCLSHSALQMSSISLQTDIIHTAEDFSSLLTDRKPRVTSISSQTESDLPDCFSPSEASVKASNPSTFSQTEQDISMQKKAEMKSSCSQTERGSPVHQPKVYSEIILETTDSSLQTEPESSDVLSRSQFQIQPETSSTCLHTASSLEHLYSVPSGLQSVADEGRTDILDLDHTLKAHDLGHSKEDVLSDAGLGSSQHSIDSSWDALEKEARSQKDSIDALHRRLELLSSNVDKTTCVFPTKYQDMNKADIIEIYCEKPEGTETKKFLLDNGRLQLEPIKLSFDLSTVELWLDGIPCVAGANIDGYIPLRFTPSTRLHITGRPTNK